MHAGLTNPHGPTIEKDKGRKERTIFISLETVDLATLVE